MRTVGRRKQQPITSSATGRALAEGARFNDELRKLPAGGTTFIPKGLYRFKTHDEANRHAERCLIEGMVQVTLEPAQWKTTVAPRRSKT